MDIDKVLSIAAKNDRKAKKEVRYTFTHYSRLNTYGRFALEMAAVFLNRGSFIFVLCKALYEADENCYVRSYG